MRVIRRADGPAGGKDGEGIEGRRRKGHRTPAAGHGCGTHGRASMKEREFKIGQGVFYPSAGVGVIEAMEEVIFGVEHELCYVIRIPENRVTIKVPKARAASNGLRPLLRGKDVKDLLEVLADKSSARPAGHWAEHYKDLERRIQSGGVLEVGSAVRDLLRLKAGAGLSFEEARLLEMADGYLVRELAAVQGVTMEAARDIIRSAVGIGP